MADGSHVPTTAIQRRRHAQSIQQQRSHLEAALERLLGAAQAVIADLDALDGDPDLEATCEDEGAQCEGEGDHDEREPEAGDIVPEYDPEDQRRVVTGAFRDERFYREIWG